MNFNNWILLTTIYLWMGVEGIRWPWGWARRQPEAIGQEQHNVVPVMQPFIHYLHTEYQQLSKNTPEKYRDQNTDGSASTAQELIQSMIQLRASSQWMHAQTQFRSRPSEPLSDSYKQQIRQQCGNRILYRNVVGWSRVVDTHTTYACAALLMDGCPVSVGPLKTLRLFYEQTLSTTTMVENNEETGYRLFLAALGLAFSRNCTAAESLIFTRSDLNGRAPLSFTSRHLMELMQVYEQYRSHGAVLRSLHLPYLNMDVDMALALQALLTRFPTIDELNLDHMTVVDKEAILALDSALKNSRLSRLSLHRSKKLDPEEIRWARNLHDTERPALFVQNPLLKVLKLSLHALVLMKPSAIMSILATVHELHIDCSGSRHVHFDLTHVPPLTHSSPTLKRLTLYKCSLFKVDDIYHVNLVQNFSPSNLMTYFGELEYLDWQFAQLSAKDVLFTQQLLLEAKLKTLALTFTPPARVPVLFVLSLRSLVQQLKNMDQESIRNLQHLSFEFNGPSFAWFQRSEFEAIGAHLDDARNQLRSLTLKAVTMQGFGMLALMDALTAPTARPLKKLALPWNGISQDLFDFAFRDVFWNLHLDWLDIGGNDRQFARSVLSTLVDKARDNSIDKPSNYTGLKHLNLAGCWPDAGDGSWFDWRLLRQVFHFNPNMEYLNLDYNSLSVCLGCQTAMASFFRLLKRDGNKLRRLSMRGTWSWSDAASYSLFDSLKSPKCYLQDLKLGLLHVKETFPSLFIDCISSWTGRLKTLELTNLQSEVPFKLDFRALLGTSVFFESFGYFSRSEEKHELIRQAAIDPRLQHAFYWIPTRNNHVHN